MLVTTAKESLKEIVIREKAVSHAKAIGCHGLSTNEVSHAMYDLVRVVGDSNVRL